MNKKIIIMEDDNDILEIVKYILEDENFEIVASRSPLSVDEIGTIQPTLILLDHLLPQISGHDLCREIKANAATKHIPVILFSAHNQVAKIATSCSADAYLSKPFNIEVLIEAVNKLLKEI